MPANDRMASEASEKNSHAGAGGFRHACDIVILLIVCAGTLALVLPAWQTTGRQPRSQAWKNLHQLSLAVSNYQSRHGALPYHPKGGDFALFLLRADAEANGYSLDAALFDSRPWEQPRREASWDDAAGRIVNSDFEYWNPDGDASRLEGHRVMIVERPIPNAEWLLLSTTDDRIKAYCVSGAHGEKLLGSVWKGEPF